MLPVCSGWIVAKPSPTRFEPTTGPRTAPNNIGDELPVMRPGLSSWDSDQRFDALLGRAIATLHHSVPVTLYFIQHNMKHGDKVGVGALSIYLLGALLLCAMGIWLDSPLQHLEMFAFCLLWAGFLISFYAAIRGSRWWLLLPLSTVCFWLWVATSKYAG